MRYILSIAALALIAAAPLPAAAQNNTGTTTGYQQQYMVPMYLAPNTAAYGTQNGTTPVYNNAGQPLPLNQMVAGRDAPSYNYNNNAYTGFNANPLSNITSVGSLTPQQSQMMAAQRDAQAAAYQNEYIAQLQRNMAPPADATGSSAYQGSAFNQLYTGNQQQRPPTKRRVSYNQRNNPLATPPRLFNPDQ